MWRRAALLFALGLIAFRLSGVREEPRLYPIIENGKLGFIDGGGKKVIPPQFAGYECPFEMPQFSEGLAPIYTKVDDGLSWRYIDTTGRSAISLPPSYFIRQELNGTFHEGVAVVQIKDPVPGGVREQTAWIDRRGRILHSDLLAPFAEFHEGLMRFQRAELWGYVDHSYQWVIPPQFRSAEDFHEGVALVTTVEAGPPDNWAYIDRAGKFLFKRDATHPQGSTTSFSDGFALLHISESGSTSRFEFMDHKGKPVIGPLDGMARDFHEGYAFVDIFGANEGHLALMDKHGREKPLSGFGPNGFNSQFHEGLAAIDKGNQYGYIDHLGNWVIPPEFEHAGAFSDGVALVDWLQKREWGYIDKHGRLIWRGVDQCKYPVF